MNKSYVSVPLERILQCLQLKLGQKSHKIGVLGAFCAIWDAFISSGDLESARNPAKSWLMYVKVVVMEQEKWYSKFRTDSIAFQEQKLRKQVKIGRKLLENTNFVRILT